MSETVQLVVVHDETETTLAVTPGRILRDVLIEAGLSPYSRLTARANCGGRGLCATCGVRVAGEAESELKPGSESESESELEPKSEVESESESVLEPQPEHWHDKLAARFGYPRLSCQITVEEDMRVELIDEKLVWGGRD